MFDENRDLRVPHARTRQTGGELVVLTTSRGGQDPTSCSAHIWQEPWSTQGSQLFPPLHGTDLLTGFEDRPGDASIDSKRLSQVMRTRCWDTPSATN